MQSPDQLIIIINGNNFDNLEGFYDEIDRLFTKNLGWKTGHNLDAFNDLLRGGFGVYEYEELVTVIWKNSDKSIIDLGYEVTSEYYSQKISSNPETRKNFLPQLELSNQEKGKTLFEILTEIINDHDHVTFIME